MHKKHLFIINSGLFENPNNVNSTKTKCLSNEFTGDLVHVIYDKQFLGLEEHGFKMLGSYIPKFFRHSKVTKNIYYIISCLLQARHIHLKHKPYDVIIARNPLLSGLIGYLLKILIKVPLIIEMNGNYGNPVVWHEGSPGFGSKVKHWIAINFAPLIFNQADIVRILYPQQLDIYGDRVNLKNPPEVMHEFTQIEKARTDGPDNNYALFLGSPWYIKGIDILIRSFNKVSITRPNCRLKIIAWLPGDSQTAMQKLADNNPCIEICKPVMHDEGQRLISECSFLILPSRTEAMGRVLLEAMAHGKAVIGSNVDGIPYYIKDGLNGLIFEKENVDDLAEKIEFLLDNTEKRKSMGQEGLQYVHQNLSEKNYLEKYIKVINTAINI